MRSGNVVPNAIPAHNHLLTGVEIVSVSFIPSDIVVVSPIAQTAIPRKLMSQYDIESLIRNPTPYDYHSFPLRRDVCTREVRARRRWFIQRYLAEGG
jgi:hypothetical protein